MKVVAALLLLLAAACQFFALNFDVFIHVCPHYTLSKEAPSDPYKLGIDTPAWCDRSPPQVQGVVRYAVTDSCGLVGELADGRWIIGDAECGLQIYGDRAKFEADLGGEFASIHLTRVSRFDDPALFRSQVIAAVFWICFILVVITIWRRSKISANGESSQIPSCRSCGHLLNPLGEVCPECGVQLGYPQGLNLLQMSIPFIIGLVLIYALVRASL